MAIAPTGAIYKSLIFDDIDSRNYGVYITGEAAYNAPEREVEMITIAGRNGQLALDKGRFENIEVTYPAGIFADNQADYAKAISDFRNALCSKVGYQRLTDEYNVDEYRMAVYKSGLEVSSVNSAGEFQITFDCQPQRFLMSGEAPITVSSGDTILNPTHFESKPMLEVEGYGTIGFNGFEIEIEDADVGTVELATGANVISTEVSRDYSSNIGLLADNDSIAMDGFSVVLTTRVPADQYSSMSITLTSEGSTNNIPNATTPAIEQLSALENKITFSFGNQSFAKGVSFSASNRYTFALTARKTSGGMLSASFTFRILLTNTASGVMKISTTRTGFLTEPTVNISCNSLIGTSSISALGNPTYIDCDLGEAYKITDGKPTSLNRYIDLGSELPTFAVGSNEITFDNTITDLKVTPRWWIV